MSVGLPIHLGFVLELDPGLGLGGIFELGEVAQFVHGVRIAVGPRSLVSGLARSEGEGPVVDGLAGGDAERGVLARGVVGGGVPLQQSGRTPGVVIELVAAVGGVELVDDVHVLLPGDSRGVDLDGPVQEARADRGLGPSVLGRLLGKVARPARIDVAAGDVLADLPSGDHEGELLDVLVLADRGLDPAATGHVGMAGDVIAERAREGLPVTSGNLTLGDLGLAILRVHGEGSDVGTERIREFDREGVTRLRTGSGRVNREVDSEGIPEFRLGRAILVVEILHLDGLDHVDLRGMRRGRQ